MHLFRNKGRLSDWEGSGCFEKEVACESELLRSILGAASDS